MSGQDLPRLLGFGFTYDYVPFARSKELVASCPQCHQRQRTGLLLGEEIPEVTIARVKDRLQRFHTCTPSAFSALADLEGIEAVMRAFGFPTWLMPGRRRSSHPPDSSRKRDARTA